MQLTNYVLLRGTPHLRTAVQKSNKSSSASGAARLTPLSYSLSLQELTL